jgi:hypothetical protein
LCIYPTDICKVTVACSDNPVARQIDDFEGLIRLATALARVQERLQRIVDEAGMSLPSGYEQIPIPDINKWIVSMCHFASDSPNYKEANYCVTWKDGQRVLYRVYSKKLKGNKDKGKCKNRTDKNNEQNDDDNYKNQGISGKRNDDGGKGDSGSTVTGNSVIRRERQEYPSKPLGDMFKYV